jgi:hypothetical protein
MLAALVARIMGKTRPNYNDGSFAVVGNPRGDLSICEGLPLKTESVRQGNTWTYTIPTGSAFTYVNALPTTRGELVIYNGDAALSYVVDAAWMVDVSTAGAAQAKTLVGQIVPKVLSANIPTSAVTPFSRSGRANYGGAAIAALANTAMGQVANHWEVISTVNTPNTASVATGCYQDLYGGWIVPPGGGLALAGVASTVAGTAIIGVTVHEVLLPVIS